MRTHIVTVFGVDDPVEVYRKSKSVWVSIGQFRGKPLSAQGRTEPAAITAWKRIAELRSDY